MNKKETKWALMSRICDMLYLNKHGITASRLSNLLVQEKLDGKWKTCITISPNKIASLLGEMKKMGLISQKFPRGYWYYIEKKGNNMIAQEK